MVSEDCHNKLPPTGQRKTTEIYSHGVLRVRSLKSSCQQGYSSSRGSRGKSFQPQLAWLTATSLQILPQFSHCLSSVPVFSSVCLKFPSIFLLYGHIIGFRTHSYNSD